MLNNGICIFKEIFNQLPKDKKINCLSCSLFKMEKGYKNFDRYIKKLKFVFQLAKSLDYYVVIFIDDSVYGNKEIYDKFKKIIDEKKSIIIKYDCPTFKNDTGYHRGVFGMFVRFFPMFDFPNNNFGNVLVCDADVDLKYYKLIDKSFFYMISDFIPKNKLDLYCVAPSPNYVRWTNKEGYWILGQLLFSTKRFPAEIIIKFLNDILNPESKTYKKIIKKDIIMSIEKQSDPIINYGIDEYFISNILIKTLIKQKYKICISFQYSTIDYILRNSSYLYYLQQNNKPIDKKWISEFYNLIKYIDDTLINDNINLSDYLFIRSKIYDNANNYLPSLYEYCKKFIKYIEECYKNKNYIIFSKDEIKKILDNKNMISYNKYVIFPEKKTFIRNQVYIKK